jgi:hypothetical protein
VRAKLLPSLAQAFSIVPSYQKLPLEVGRTLTRGHTPLTLDISALDQRDVSWAWSVSPPVQPTDSTRGKAENNQTLADRILGGV